MVEALSGSVVAHTLGGSALPENYVAALQDYDDTDSWETCVLGTLLQQLLRIHAQPVCVSLQVIFFC